MLFIVQREEDVKCRGWRLPGSGRAVLRSQLPVQPLDPHCGLSQYDSLKSDRAGDPRDKGAVISVRLYSLLPLVRTQTGPSLARLLVLVRPPQPSQNPPGKCSWPPEAGKGREHPPPALAQASKAPRPERAPAPLARCGVSVSPAGFSPLRWSGK